MLATSLDHVPLDDTYIRVVVFETGI